MSTADDLRLTKAQLALMKKAAAQGRISPYASQWNVFYGLRAIGLMAYTSNAMISVELTEAGRRAIASAEADERRGE